MKRHPKFERIDDELFRSITDEEARGIFGALQTDCYEPSRTNVGDPVLMDYIKDSATLEA